MSITQHQDDLTSSERPTLLPAPSREVALFALLALALLITRLAGLGRWALTARELTGAVSALGWLRGEQVIGLGYSPLQWLLQVPLFALTRPSEWAARLPTALASVALAALIYGQRRWLGRMRALSLIALLLVSPTLLHLGRQADGAFLGAAAALAATLLGRRALANDDPRTWRWFALSMALGLTAGAGFVTWLLALIIMGLGWLWWRRRQARQLAWPAFAGQPLWWGVVALLAVATAGMAHLAGLGGLTELVGSWFSGGTGAVAPWHLPLRNLLLYEPLLLLLGGVGAVSAWRAREPLGCFALGWLGVALVVALAGHREAYWQADLVMPLALLAAGGLAPLWAALRAGRGTPAIIAWACLALLLAFGVVNLAMFGHTNQAGFAWLAAGAIIMIAGLWAGFWLWEGRAPAITVGVALLLVTLAAMTVRTAVAVGYQTARDPREPLVYDPVALSPRQWNEFLTTTSLNIAGDQHALAVVWSPSVALPARWYLRDMPDAQPLTPANGAAAAALFTWAAPEQRAPAGYVGQRLPYHQTWTGEGLLPSDWVRWLLGREAVGWQEAGSSIALWYRLERGEVSR